ncbi:MAG: hypothetical protein JNM91_11980 [Flavobacteriales bacterium]|nr:hypothetical protein [Flavobacteriales bacterium]
MTQNNDKHPVQKVTGTGTLDHAGKPAASGKQDDAVTDVKDSKEKEENTPDPARTTMNTDKDHADRKKPK